jgi:DnaA family protein
MRQLLLDITQAPAPSFENFVPGRNAEALAALRSAAAGRLPERVVYLWGEAGSGKSHLARALAAACPGARLVAGAAYDGDAAGTIVIDGVESLDDARQVALFNAFNERAHGLIVVTAGAAPKDVPLRRDLATRLATGLTYRLLGLSDDEKREALLAHARARGFALSDEVASYLLTHARRDMRSLIRALDALDRHSVETGRPITVPLLKAALQPELSGESP